jgi:hypothetical protein
LNMLVNSVAMGGWKFLGLTIEMVSNVTRGRCEGGKNFDAGLSIR